MRKKIYYISLLLGFLLLLTSSMSFAVGFKKLDVSSKYGSHQDTRPIKAPDGTSEPVQKTVVDPDDEPIYFNGVDVDIKDMINQISALTGKNFIIDSKVRGKITIISDKKMTKDEAYQAFLSALEINGYTTVMTPSGLINIVQQKESLNKPLEVYKDESPNTDKYVTRIIQLANISANEVSSLIKGMVSKTGNMFAYPTTNSIIITDTGSNIQHLLALIQELDQEGPQETMEMIPIVNADAKDIAEKITEIFESKDSKSSSSRSVRSRRSRTTTPEMEDVQAISKVLADERTNSVLVFGTKRGILKVREFIAKLDRTIGGAEGRIHVYYLKYAKAEDVASVLSNLVSGSSSSSKSSSSKTSRTSKAKSSTSSGAVTLEGGVQVTADADTNSLIVVASPKDYQTLVSQVIEKLDLLRPQVYLEAVIMSLDVSKSNTLGISGLGGFINTLSGGNQFNIFGGIMPGTPNAITTLAGASGGFGGGAFSSDTIDFTLSDGSTASVPAVSGIIMALASDTDANVLSTPSILTLDNEEAKIQVGKEVPVPSGTTVSSGVTTFDVTREDTGIILTITPQISENDSVRLQIAQEISSVYTSDANLGPTLDKKAVETVVVAKDKQTIVIGGLIDDKQTVTTHKVPLLGDIPVLGSLFRTRINTKEKTNLLVFITPYIIRDRKDYLSVLKKKIEERNQFIDMNYGKSQRKHIRRAILDHAENLLEFSCQTMADEDPCYAAVTTTSSQNHSASDANYVPEQTDTTYFGPPKKVRYKN